MLSGDRKSALLIVIKYHSLPGNVGVATGTDGALYGIELAPVEILVACGAVFVFHLREEKFRFRMRGSPFKYLFRRFMAL